MKIMPSNAYSNKVQLSNSIYKYNNSSNPFFTAISEEKSDDSKMSTKKKFSIGAVAVSVIGFITGLIKYIKKPSKVKSKEIKAGAEVATKSIEDLLKELKPKNFELAREFYPVLEKNKETLQLKPEDYNSIISNIDKPNQSFMKERGIELISSSMEKMKDLICSPAEDVSLLVRNITKDNEDIFTHLINKREDFNIELVDDIINYLKHITSKNKDYIFNKVIPATRDYIKPLKLKTSEKHANILAHITPETEQLVPKIAESNVLEDKGISKYQFLMNVNNDNKDCIEPLLMNIENLELDKTQTFEIMKNLKNNQAKVISSAGKNSKTLKDTGITLSDVLDLVKDEKSLEIFNTVIKNPKGYIIEEKLDLKNYSKNLKSQNMEFVDKVLFPKLSAHAKDFDIHISDQMAEIMGKVTPETVDCIDTIASYSKKYGNNIYYVYLLQAITPKNKANLPKVMENIKNTEVWGNPLVSPEDFAQLLNSKAEV